MSLRSYSELIQIDSFMGRYEYLKLSGAVGESTFGHDRWMNQQFYHSQEWYNVRQFVIARDEGCDLAWHEFPIHRQLHIHHMNPMVKSELAHGDPVILDPEFLVTVSHRTHNAIHYGDERQLPRPFVERRPGDHMPWKERA
jgi:hypothetical protein